VVEADRLVGIVTAYDFLAASASLFEKYLTANEETSGDNGLLENASISEALITKGVGQ
jgi:CBS domain-containing protein